jgi:hypothetical protein
MQRVFISLALLGGCIAAEGDESFIIRSNLAAEGGTCVFQPSLDASFLARGQLFLDSPIPYLINPMLESRIVAAQGKESLRTILLEGANITLNIGPIERIGADGSVSLDETVETAQFQSLFSAPLPPNGGLASAQFDLVPLSVVAGIRARAGAPGLDRIHAQVTASMVVFGDYYGERLESNPFQYPVTVCNDCVVANRFADGTFPTCDTFTATARQGNPCNVFQDGVVDCCDAGNGLIQCPAIATGPSE